MKGAEPFFIKKGKIGALIAHGYTSSPQEMQFLKNYLTKRNITVYCPLIAGHGTKWQDLAKTNEKDWLESLDKAYLELKKYCNKIFFIGGSFGANLGVLLSRKRKFDGLILMGMPIKHRLDKYKKLIFLWPLFYLFKKKIKKRYNPKDYNVVKNKVHYLYIPVRNAWSVIKVINKSKNLLKEIQEPTLVMQSDHDFQLTNENARFIYNSISSKNKKLYFINNAYHVFVLDKGKEKAFNEIYKFIKQNS